LVGTKYEDRSFIKENVFGGTFCFWATRQFATVREVQKALNSAVIVAPDVLAQHYILHDAAGEGLIVELVDGQKKVYLDLNDKESGFGITTNEPTLDWHIENVKVIRWVYFS